jgi:hypothetical protein
LSQLGLALQPKLLLSRSTLVGGRLVSGEFALGREFLGSPSLRRRPVGCGFVCGGLVGRALFGRATLSSFALDLLLLLLAPPLGFARVRRCRFWLWLWLWLWRGLRRYRLRRWRR